MTTPRRVRLSTTHHPTEGAGLTYVYAVLSRRAGGVSVGVNLSPNRACNWRCVYCQVPGLVRGTSPRIDLDLLERELDATLAAAGRGELFTHEGPGAAPTVVDVAFSGDGEPTTSPDFGGAVERVARVLERHGLALPIFLITNGSRAGSPRVQAALRTLAAHRGVVWFKLDRATRPGLRATNGVAASPDAQLARLRACAAACPTWVQSCFFLRRGEAPAAEEVDAWLRALASLAKERVPLRGVQLYTLARPPMQEPEASELAPVPRAWLEALADRVHALGLHVRVV
jgi:pyruvate-formate lyase-activating enzyme